MKTMLRLIALLVLIIVANGCETYQKSPLTPDSFNYTLQRDRETGNMSDYVGFSWKLK